MRGSEVRSVVKGQVDQGPVRYLEVEPIVDMGSVTGSIEHNNDEIKPNQLLKSRFTFTHEHHLTIQLYKVNLTLIKANSTLI